MIYKNTKTGAMLDSPCVISGGDWVEEGKSSDVPDLSKRTVAELKEMAAEAGIDLGEATRKDDIIAVIQAAEESASKE